MRSIQISFKTAIAMIAHKRFLTAPGWIPLYFALLPELLGVVSPHPLRATPWQAEIDVSPEATPEIRQVKPNQAAVGSEATLAIEGRNFSRGAYVSFSNPALRVVSTRRVSATQLETKVAVGAKAQPGTVSLYVSNPASSVAEGPFVIAGASAPPVPPSGAEIQPSEVGTPEVVAVDPASVKRGTQANVKIVGKNFAKGTKVAFSNQGILVLETNVAKDTQLTARIQIASDAPVGRTGLFVVNPDDREVEVAFDVEGETPTPAAGTPTAEGAGLAAQRFEVFNLGEGINILQNPNKPKGTLTVAGGRLKYEEGGKEVFSAAGGEIKEIEANVLFGVNTGTFHIIVSSGKTYNFVAASLLPPDTQSIIDSLRRALRP